jgi:hypothetical protein
LAVFLTFHTTTGPVTIDAADISRFREFPGEQYTKVWLKSAPAGKAIIVMESHQAIVAALQSHYCVETVLKPHALPVPPPPKGVVGITVRDGKTGDHIASWGTDGDGHHTPS